MRHILTTSLSAILLGGVSISAAYAEAPTSLFTASSCAEWQSNVPVNVDAIEKLKRNLNGGGYTKNSLVVLLGKNLVAARDMLANGRDKLAKTSDGKIDLQGVVLNGFDLSGLNLDSVDFKGAEMNGVNLSGSSLRDAYLYKAELEGANLNNANLTYANLSKAKLGNASMCHATLIAADLEDAVMIGTYLKDAKLDRAKKVPKAIYMNTESVLHFGLPVPEN